AGQQPDVEQRRQRQPSAGDARSELGQRFVVRPRFELELELGERQITKRAGAASVDPDPEPRRFFFVHVQKTAGTALWRRMKEQFAPAAVYPGPGDGEPPDTVLSVEHLRARWVARRAELRVVTGHFPLCTVELLDAPFVTLTLLRDPVERTLSQLRHHR